MSCSSDCQSIEIGSTHTLTFDSVQDTAGNYLNAGTAGYTLSDLDGNEIGTGTLSYVTDSDGKYVGAVPASQTGQLNEDQTYTVTVVFVQDAVQVTKRLIVTADYGD